MPSAYPSWCHKYDPMLPRVTLFGHGHYRPLCPICSTKLASWRQINTSKVSILFTKVCYSIHLYPSAFPYLRSLWISAWRKESARPASLNQHLVLVAVQPSWGSPWKKCHSNLRTAHSATGERGASRRLCNAISFSSYSSSSSLWRGQLQTNWGNYGRGVVSHMHGSGVFGDSAQLLLVVGILNSVHCKDLLVWNILRCITLIFALQQNYGSTRRMCQSIHVVMYSRMYERESLRSSSCA